MAWASWKNSALVRCLVVAVSILGTGADALPRPLLAATGLCDSDVEDPYSPSQEDERDETPDDASDLTWPLLRLVARSGQSDPFVRLARLLRSSTLAYESAPGRHDFRPNRPPGLDEVTVPLPIALCRL